MPDANNLPLLPFAVTKLSDEHMVRVTLNDESREKGLTPYTCNDCGILTLKEMQGSR